MRTNFATRAEHRSPGRRFGRGGRRGVAAVADARQASRAEWASREVLGDGQAALPLARIFGPWAGLTLLARDPGSPYWFAAGIMLLATVAGSQTPEPSTLGRGGPHGRPRSPRRRPEGAAQRNLAHRRNPRAAR